MLKLAKYRRKIKAKNKASHFSTNKQIASTSVHDAILSESALPPRSKVKDKLKEFACFSSTVLLNFFLFTASIVFVINKVYEEIHKL